MHRILSRAVKVAMRRGRVPRNVARLVDAPTVRRPEIVPLTATDAGGILATAASERNAARWSVALALGLRQGEALGLGWGRPRPGQADRAARLATPARRRRTAATLLLARGVPARVAMQILGHSQISLTLATYSHVVP
jgi:integrase